MCHARLEAEAGRYSFLVLDFHLLPLDGFHQRTKLAALGLAEAGVGALRFQLSKYCRVKSSVGGLPGDVQ